ncbi:serine/threonine-protein kinase [Actinomadura alba]|uniref:Serine/threonine protein kinase n=1 Tax=Actinomadura alba TaxID=406431 RepID=A0ABR7LMN9_9ACTN|nr:serine/threonine-protein kinase [Actinomadura alba]MBC6466073.1 serine/threonine protein kinase [Actinomadura alba]
MSAENVVDPLTPGDPRTLGAYRLVGRIGRGGMGTVYLAESSAGERAAVKVINPDLAHDPSFRDRFRREVESARRVRRFCTAPVLDANLDGDLLYIVTEYVNGPNLHEFVRDSGPMRGATLDHLAVGVATALTAIHGAGVVHRDLKPANVLLSSLGPRVIDFGIARALDTVVDQTKTGQFVGTPAYMAPEIIGGGRATAASDVFAWGAVVAYAGTGETAFPGATLPAVLYRISHGEPQIEGLEDEIRQLVERALAKDPALRPSAQELLDGLVGQDRADTAQTAETLRSTWQTHPSSVPPSPVPPPGGPYPGQPTRADGPGTLMAPPGAFPGNGPAAPVPPGRAPGHGPGRTSGGGRGRTLALAGAVVAGFLVLALLAVLWLTGSGGPPTSTTPVFSDDFSSTGTRWSGGEYNPILGTGYLGGRYRLGTTGNDTDESSVAPYDAELPPRVLVSADVTPVSGPKYGQVGLWCFGETTNLDGYLFLVRLDGDGAVIRKVSGSNISKELVAPPDAKGFETQGVNKIQIACEQQQDKSMHLRMWLNGELAAEYTDAATPLTRGKAGIVVMRQGGGSGGQMSADYDNFEISRINDK